MDHCTLWFDRIEILGFVWDWSHCCVQHDFDYAAGVWRHVADGKLKHCVNDVLPGMGSLMYWAVGVIGFGALFYAKQRSKRGS